jgi:hypothetical protein
MDQPLVVREDRTGLITAQSDDSVASLPAAMEQIHRALNGMVPDDLVIEFSAEGTGEKRRASFRFRAYRR